MGKQAFEGARRDQMFWVSPDDITVAESPQDPLYDERLDPKTPAGRLEEGLVDSIMRRGVLAPIEVRKNGTYYEVVDGRRRLRHAKVANERLAKLGRDPISVPVFIKRGLVDADLLEDSVVLNEHRVDDGAMTKARKASRLLAMGKSEEAVAAAFGVKSSTVKAWLSALDTAPEVQTAVERGEIQPTAAARLAKLTRDEQKEALAELLASGDTTTQATDAKVRERAGAKAAASNGGTVAEDAAKPPARTVLRKLVAHENAEATLGEEFLKGVRFALGSLKPQRIKGLTAMLDEIGDARRKRLPA